MSEHTHRKAVLDDVLRLGRALRQQSPTSYKSYAALSTSAKAPGSLDATTKRTDRPRHRYHLRFDETFGVALTLQRMEARDHDRRNDG